jgi:hypothetical protein
LSAKGEEKIMVSYNLTNTTKATVEGDWVTTKIETQTVTLSISGETESFSGGQSTISSPKKK